MNSQVKHKLNKRNSSAQHSVLRHGNGQRHISRRCASDVHWFMPTENGTPQNKPQDDWINDIDGTQLPERHFMNALLKHTAIALAIIIPLAAYSVYA